MHPRAYVFLSLAAFLLGLGLLNTVLAPTAKRQAQMAEAIRHWPKGMVWNLYSTEERLVKLSFIEAASKTDLVLLGSSRGKPAHLGSAREKFLNLSVYAASLEDEISLWQALKESGKLPSKVFIMFDPWLLNENFKPASFGPLDSRFFRYCGSRLARNHDLRADWGLSRLALSHNGDYLGYLFQPDALFALFQKQAPALEAQFKPETWSSGPEFTGVREDASTVFVGPRLWQDLNTKAVTQKPSEHLPGMEGWSMARTRMAVVEDWFRDIRSQGATLLVAASPLTDAMQNAMEERHHADLAEIDAWLQRCKDQGLIEHLSLIHRAKELGCDERKYLDSSHAGPECLQCLYQQILKN
jgi:hypothetical protein